MAVWPPSPFWDFSVALYRRPGVEGALLALQNRHDLDVNLVLFACWLAHLGIEFDQPLFARAEKATSAWRSGVIRPLRAIRMRLGAEQPENADERLANRWGDLVSGLKKEVLATELNAEHLAQLALTEIIANVPSTQMSSIELAGLNLNHHWPFAGADLDDLGVLLRQSFPSTTDDTLAGVLRRFRL